MTSAYNRLKQFIQCNPHKKYLSHGPYVKVARESGLAVSTVTRLRRGYIGQPSFAVLVKLAEFFERHYGLRIDPREIVYPGGSYQPQLSFAYGDLVQRAPTPEELAAQTQENYQDERESHESYANQRPNTTQQTNLTPSTEAT